MPPPIPPPCLSLRMGLWTWFTLLCKYVRGLFGHYDPDCYLIALPPEILNMITSHLEKSHLTLFALTCRLLHRLYSYESRNLRLADRIELLRLLAKDSNPYYFCPQCIKLHPWKLCSPFSTIYRHERETRHYTRGRSCTDRCGFLRSGSYFIPYHYARLVMSAHLYGALHGIPVHDLNDHRTFTFSRDVSESYDWEARIIDNQLLVSSTITFVQKQGNEKLLKEHIASHGPSICHHMRTSDGNVLSDSRWTLPELSSGGEGFIPCAGSVRSCPVCMTDCCIDIHWDCSGRGWIIKIITYQQLGSARLARSPDDWAWINLTGYPSWPYRFRHPAARPGLLRHIWSKADKETLDIEGRWVRELEFGTVIDVFHLSTYNF